MMPGCSRSGAAAAFLLGCSAATLAWGAVLRALRRRQQARARVRSPPHLVPMPHPGWTPGQPQAPPFGYREHIQYDPAAHDKASTYALVISAIVPRPIALVSSMNAAGALNVAPYSYFNVMGHAPPVFCIGITRSPGRGGGKKDTLANIEETGTFVVNIMSEWYVEAANHTCGDYDAGVDEMQLAGLTPQPSHRVPAPRVKEAAVQMECKLRQVVDVTDPAGNPSVAIVVGEVLLFHISQGVASQSPTGKLVVDAAQLCPISRLGGTTYGTSTHLFDIGRPTKAHSHVGPALYTAKPAPAVAAK